MEKYKVGIIGATGMVGQRFVTLMENHPWFQLTALAASPRSAGKPYEQAVAGRWAMKSPIPQEAKALVVLDAQADVDRIAGMVDFVFCAVDMKKDEIRALEERYAKAECPVVSNNSANRWTEDVPMVVPELNAEHIRIIDAQRKRLGTKRGFIAVKSNCSIQSYTPLLTPLMRAGYEVDSVLACTYQAISGAGKTFERWPEMVDNLIPYIGGEEEKSEQEPLKVWGHIEGGRIVKAAGPAITTQCLRVPVSDGHTAAVFVRFKAGKKPEYVLGGADQGHLEELQGPGPGAGPPLRPQAVYPLLRGARPSSGQDRPGAGGRHGYLRRTPAPRQPVRLQICGPVPQHPARRSRWQRPAGRAAVCRGVY